MYEKYKEWSYNVKEKCPFFNVVLGENQWQR